MRVKLPLMVVACFVGSVLLSPLVFAQGGGRANVPVPPAPPAAPTAPQAPTPPTPSSAPSAPTAPAAAQSPQVSFKVDFVLTRFQGDKKLSSLPYSMLVASGANSATLRSGSQVPMPGPGKDGTTTVTYQSVGVSIGVSGIFAVADGRYSIRLNFDDSSLIDSDAPGASTLGPVIRSNSFGSNVIVREGQPLQFSVATDKVSGETLKAELTLTVLK